MRTRQIIFAIIFLFLQPVFLFSQSSFQDEGFPPQRMPPSHGGPWNQDIDLYESQDGIHFVKRAVLVKTAGVPNLLRVGGKLYAVFQWFPFERIEAFDKIAIVTSDDGGRTWTEPEPIEMKGMPKIIRRAFDPTLVNTGNGSFRLYFASDRMKPERQMFRHGNRAVFSAISRDGFHYEFEPGERFGFDEAETYDPAAVDFQGQWHLFCPGSTESSAYHAISNDGLNFSTYEEIFLEGSGTWIGNVIQTGNQMSFYGSGRGGIWLATSTNGKHWQLADQLDLRGGDPAVVQLANGTFLALVTSEPRRSDTAPRLPPDHFD